MGKFVVKQTKTGPMFALKAGNGETIGVSQIYSVMEACFGGIESVRANATVAEVEDLTARTPKKQENPKFEIYFDNAKEFRFRLKAENGQVILSSEGYRAKVSCINGILSVKKNAAASEFVIEE